MTLSLKVAMRKENIFQELTLKQNIYRYENEVGEIPGRAFRTALCTMRKGEGVEGRGGREEGGKGGHKSEQSCGTEQSPASAKGAEENTVSVVCSGLPAVKPSLLYSC